MGIDNVIAAIVLSLIMLRRLEVRAARAQDNPHVAHDVFAAWQKQLLNAYDLGALACVLKVGLTLGWHWAVIRWSIGQPWYTALPATVFVLWVVVLVSVWRRVSEARTQQERLGIGLGRREAL